MEMPTTAAVCAEIQQFLLEVGTASQSLDTRYPRTCGATTEESPIRKANSDNH
jgi:hypothetical protein